MTNARSSRVAESRDLGNQSQLTVTSTTGTDSIGSYTQVTVSYPFTTLTSYPGLPKTVTITRSAQVRVAPQVPK